jgi:hypothetical protein
MARLDREGAANVLNFSTEDGPAPTIESITVQ